MIKSISKIKILLPIFIAVLTFTIRFQMLLQSSEPSGLDGYFYALQAKSFALNGRLENPDYKIGYYLCGVFAFIFRNPVLGCKIYASLVSSFLILSIYAALKSLRTDYGFCILGCSVAAASFSIASMSINYINNLTGIIFFIFYASSVFALDLKTQGKKSHFILPVVLFILCFLSHLVSSAFAFVFTVLMVLRKRSIKKQVVFFTGALLLAVIVFSRQLPRFNSVFSLGPVFPVFSRFMVKTIGFRICLELSIAFAFGWIVFIGVVIFSIKKKSFDILLLFIPVLFFPFWNLSVLDMGYRMLLSAVPCGIIIAFHALDGIITCPRKTLAGIFAAMILVPFGFATKSSYDVSRDPPYAYYKKVVRNIELSDDSLLIAHLGLNHVYTYEKNLRDALNYVPDFYVPAEKLWRLAYGVNVLAIEENLYDVPEDVLEECVRKIDSSYVLIREDLWQKFLAREEEVYVHNYLNWYNPHSARPSFIRRRRKSFDRWIGG